MLIHRAAPEILPGLQAATASTCYNKNQGVEENSDLMAELVIIRHQCHLRGGG